MLLASIFSKKFNFQQKKGQSFVNKCMLVILKIWLKFVVNRMEIVGIRLRCVLKNMPPENSSSIAIFYYS